MSGTPQAGSVLEHFARWEAALADRTYMTQPQGDGTAIDYSWAEVGSQARRMAAHLLSLNLPPKSTIAIIGKNSAHWIMADLAAWMAGFVTVPLYPTIGPDTARYVLEHSEAKLLFVGKLDGISDSWNQLRDVLPAELPKIALPLSPLRAAPQWDTLIAKQQPLQKFVERDPDELATIVYTSGTTGSPKGVMHSLRSIAAPCRTAAELWGATTGDRVLSYLPLAHIAERAAIEVPSMVFGMQVFFADRLETFQQDLKRARPTIFFSVPRLWTKFYLAINAKLPPRKQKILFSLPLLSRVIKRKILSELGLDQTRVAMTGAAPLAPHIIAWYRQLGLELLEVFGMTENCATSHICTPGDMRVGYVGKPVPGVECRIGDGGEILVKSPGQMLGYFKMPEKTAADTTADGFFHTGDCGEIDKDGRLRVTGRVKEIFKTSKGKYVAPSPIENRLSTHAKVEAVCVTGPTEPQPFGLLMLSLDAQQELRDGQLTRDGLGAEFEALLDRVNESLEDHEKLSCLVVVGEQWSIDNGFLTPTLKIKRNVVEQHYLPQVERWRATRQKVIWA